MRVFPAPLGVFHRQLMAIYNGKLRFGGLMIIALLTDIKVFSLLIATGLLGYFLLAYSSIDLRARFTAAAMGALMTV